jgi:hypothetical protein
MLVVAQDPGACTSPRRLPCLVCTGLEGRGFDVRSSVHCKFSQVTSQDIEELGEGMLRALLKGIGSGTRVRPQA